MKHSWNEEEQGRGIMADRFDLDAIEADDALLDLLAAGGESARAAGEHDPAVALLAELRLAVEVEDELPEESIDDPESFLARCAALNPITDPFARKVATRGLAFGVAAVAALSVSGVAAAVNGDPLSPYEKVIEKMVDAVRPQTSFPKEDLDGLPVVDRSKIVKVGKDFQAKAKAGHINSTGADDPTDTPQAQKTVDPPVVPVEKPMVNTLPLETTAPTPPLVQQTQNDDEQTDPSATQTTEPSGSTTTDAPTSDPTSAPSDAPTDAPTDAPSTPADPTTDPTGAPTTAPTDPGTTTPPENVDDGSTDNGSSDPTTAPGGDSNGSDSSGTDPNGSDPSGNPTTVPSGDPTTGDSTAPADGTTKPPADQTGGVDPSTDPAGTVPPGTDPLTSGLAAVPNAIGTVVDQIVDAVAEPSVLPTPTGQPTPLKSAEQYFGKSGKPAAAKSQATSTAKAKATARAAAKAKKAAALKAAKHSNGKVSTGSVRKSYAKGKHSTGQYPEGKHAAIARTHGSTDDSNLLAILGIVNAPTDKKN